MRTTEPPDPAGRKRAPRASTAKIVLTGCSTGVALGMVGVMALAEAPAPPAPTLEASPAVTEPMTTTTLPPRRVITYVYRPVIVQDAAPEQAASAPRPRAVAVPAGSQPRAAAPAPSPAPARPRASAPTTTTTQAS